MRKLYRKSTVHPTLTSSSSSTNSDHHHHLACFLPATILTLTTALTPEDKEVLAYLLSSNYKNNNLISCNSDYRTEKHSALFTCSCFRCYMSYWVRWDCSPNRHLIHEIIDAFEDSLVDKKSSCSSKKSRRSKKAAGKRLCVSELTLTELDSVKDVQTGVDANKEGGGGGFSDDGLEEKGGSVRKFVNFIGDSIWGVFWW